ncbi:MAG TPA: universal stress protein [Alphaproteobacteria bacterium]|jgi:nucleotide-binding universal stress UspA family protein|nr:universal stress protein [Alphaproteobacteria bacterium]
MAIKKILVPISDAKDGSGALAAALALGRDFNAQVVVLHVRPDPRAEAIAYMGEPMSSSMVDEVMRSAEKRAAQNAAKVRKAFDDACAKAKVAVSAKSAAPNAVSASFEEVTGIEDEELRDRGRVVDLLVVARPQGPLAGPQRLTLEAALIDTGRPAIVVPPKAPAKIGGNVAIAWNNSTQASRAVALAMDFLVGASTVTILTAKENGSDYRPNDLKDYLAAHGVSAKVAAVSGKGDAAKAILSAATKAGADLLVMGAYGHSRVRELVLGGVTKHMLQSTTIPTFMVH